MARYSTPDFTREAVNAAGKTLAAAESDPFVAGIAEAREAVDNWRAAHAYPAQVFYMTVKRHAKKLKREDAVAQRIKRMPSIVNKLLNEPGMKLSQMQDIAGVRTVVKDIGEVEQMVRSLTSAGWNHEVIKPKDYILSPKESGYRGVHLKFKYRGEGEKAVYNDLKVEVQIRTQLQHQWATAVEATDNLTKQSLKHSKGDPAWKRFFALMSSVMAISEDRALVPNTPSTYEALASEIFRLDMKHKIAAVFAGLTKALIPHIEGASGSKKYFLLTLDPVARRARIRAFMEEEAKLAQAEYRLAESRLPPDSLTQVVLVSTSSVKALKRVYPNYFLDTVEFNKAVSAVIEDGAKFSKQAKAAA